MDNQHQFDTQIEAYFKGLLSFDDKKAFEQSLKTNKALQEAFKPYTLFDKAIEIVGERELQHMAQRIAAENQPLSVPNLSFWERLSLFFSKKSASDTAWFQLPQWRFTFAGLSTGIAVCFLYANIFVLSYDDISSEMLNKVESVETKGDNPVTAFSDSERLYYAENVSNLEKRMRDTNATVSISATYYLAHLYLKNKAFDNALAAFDKILLPNNLAMLQAEINPNMCTIKINRLLAILGKNKNKEEINRMIDALSSHSDCQTQKAKMQLAAIRKEINSIWRFLKIGH